MHSWEKMQKGFWRNNDLPIRRASGELPGARLLIDRDGICPFQLKGESDASAKGEDVDLQTERAPKKQLRNSLSDTQACRDNTPFLNLSLDSR